MLVIGIDLAGDKQAIAVIDHDVRVLARKTVRVKAFRLGPAMDWAVAQASWPHTWIFSCPPAALASAGVRSCCSRATAAVRGVLRVSP